MLNCDLCMKDIGSLKEPIFAANNDALVCKGCCAEIEGAEPMWDRAEFDPEDVSDEDVKKYIEQMQSK